jgi:hypothetical protein
MNRQISGLKAVAFTFALLSLLSLLAAVAFGQAISGNVVGNIVDSSGAVVPNADVEAVNVGTGATAVSKTGSAGEYRFENLLGGDYRITAKAAGFRTVTQSVTVLLNQTRTVNITLAPGSASETIEVSGAATAIDTTTQNIQNTFEAKALQDLPTASTGLGVLNLSLLNAGVASSGGIGVGTGPSVSGQRPRNNNFTVEGVDNNSKSVTGPVVVIPNDAVENFTVLQNQFSPEFGHSSGGQFNQTIRSGSNSFHGRAYEYFNNRNLNATDSLLGGGPKPNFDDNRYGGQIGGPIIKNKLFFFSNNEYQTIRQRTG